MLLRLPFAGLLLLPLVLLVPGSDPPVRHRPAPDDGARVSFNRDIRPLLSDRCFKCHGFDANQRKADLRLDTWDGLTTDLGGIQVIMPGSADDSELISRIDAKDDGMRMPPPSSGLALTDAERALIRRWIDEGAPFEPHWSFVPPTRPELPGSGDAGEHPIDRFVARAARDRGLALSPEADRETLIRRVSLDLIGLPPTLAEMDAFLGDESPDAYERVVDRLLTSPHYGERLALMWLDAARYADTNGFHHDNIRTIWPYRDWVIDAFNRNVPYDRFVVEQIAGDLLPDATEAQRIASAFCRLHNINDEGGALDDEYRVEAVVDRIETVATVIQGLTFTCARCHDHKYDPITQEDYYSLFAFFNSIDERGVYPNDFEQARAYPARLLYRTERQRERLADLTPRLDAARQALDDAEPEIRRELESWESALRTSRGLREVEATLAWAHRADGSELERLDDGSVATTSNPEQDAHTFTLLTDATGLSLLRLEALTDPRCGKESVGLASHGNAVVTSITAEAVSLRDPSVRRKIAWRWAWADHEQPNGDFDALNLVNGEGDGWAMDGHRSIEPHSVLLLADEPFGYEGGTAIRVVVAYRSRFPNHVLGRPRVSFLAADADLLADFPTVTSDWWQSGPHRGESFDDVWDRAFGPEGVTVIDRDQKFAQVGWRHRPEVVDGEALELKGERSAFYFARTIRTPVARTMRLSLGSDDAIRVFLNGAEVLANKALRGVAPDQEDLALALRPGENVLVVKIVNDGGPGGFYHRVTTTDEEPGRLQPTSFNVPARQGDALRARWIAAWGRESSPTYRGLLGAVNDLEKQRETLEGQAVPVLVMEELQEPTPTFVLTRGRYDLANPKRPVSRRPPTVLGGKLPDGEPTDRLGLARWLVAPDNPLTARVHVNRLWQMLFGRGLVETAENFGMQGSWPSHPRLLDWLAVQFSESGWDQKALLRLMVTSATYRQQAIARPEAKAADPKNLWLSHFPRLRLTGELIRDQALFVSGLLVATVGGPSVKPYQPDGLWREVSIGGSSNTRLFERDDGDALYRRSLYTFWKRTSPNPQMTTFDAPTREFCVVRRSATNTPLQALVLWNDVQFLEAARVLAQRTLAESDDDELRIERLFRLATGRRPGDVERPILRDLLRAAEARYRDAPDDAAKLVRAGESPRAMDVDPVALAAWMTVASCVLSLDETLVRD